MLPWITEPLQLEFLKEDSLAAPVQTINDLVDAIDAEDPWVKETFGKVGPGEGTTPSHSPCYSRILLAVVGVVCYPVGFQDKETRLVPQLLFSAFVFKVMQQ